MRLVGSTMVRPAKKVLASLGRAALHPMDHPQVVVHHGDPGVILAVGPPEDGERFVEMRARFAVARLARERDAEQVLVEAHHRIVRVEDATPDGERLASEVHRSLDMGLALGEQAEPGQQSRAQVLVSAQHRVLERRLGHPPDDAGLLAAPLAVPEQTEQIDQHAGRGVFVAGAFGQTQGAKQLLLPVGRPAELLE
jgi:hypothetical protein